jgi:hypothetical protein
MEERKVYYHNLGKEWPICKEFHDIEESYDYDARNVPDEDYPKLIEQFKGFVKAAPRFLEPYLWLEVMYDRDRKRRSSEAILKKATLKAFQMVMGKERKWPDECSWGDLNNRVLIRIFLREAESLWHVGQMDRSALKEALIIYLNLLKSNPYDNPCARFYALAILEGISNDDFHDKFTDYDVHGDYFKEGVFEWFEKQGTKHKELAWWFEYAQTAGLL